MSVPHLWERISLRVAVASVRNAAALLPAGRRDWAEAVLAEVAAIAPAGARLHFAFSASFGLLRIAAADALHGRWADPGVVLLALLTGFVAALVDLHAAGRWPLWLLLGGGCLWLGALAPRAAWRWGLLAALPLPLLAWLTGFPGPYAHDPGDVWYPLGPAILLSCVGALAAGAVRHWLIRAPRRAGRKPKG